MRRKIGNTRRKYVHQLNMLILLSACNMRSVLFVSFIVISVNGIEILFKPRGHFFDKKFRLLIEDFVYKTNVKQQLHIDELLMGTSLVAQTNGNSHRFYHTAFKNLKKIVPNLEFMTIDGGYILKPVFGTARELINEVAYLKEHMAAIVISAQEHNIELLSLIVGVGYLFNPKIADQVNLRKLLAKHFLAEPIRDPKLYEYTLSFQMAGVRCDLSVTISGMRTPTVPTGRTHFIDFTRLPHATMDTVARLYYNHVRISGRFDP